MPRPPRFFITPEQIAGVEITIVGEDLRHIGTVLRMKTGDELLLCDGSGTEYLTRITALDKNEVRSEILNRSSRGPRSPRITLGQGLPKSDKMDFITQKATELGVSEIVPLVTERTIVKVHDEEKRITRWRKIAKEAAMQSNRPDIPQIGPIISFKDYLQTLNSGLRTLLLFPWEEASGPVKQVLRSHSGVQQVVVLIGPEGGFSQAEAGSAINKGFHPVSLGPNILRTETAAVAALSMIGYELF